jgi:hypothetical protein
MSTQRGNGREAAETDADRCIPRSAFKEGIFGESVSRPAPARAAEKAGASRAVATANLAALTGDFTLVDRSKVTLVTRFA